VCRSPENVSIHPARGIFRDQKKRFSRHIPRFVDHRNT
jgi:hypothetical protein